MRALIIIALALTPSLAEACKSCGRYGSYCRYVAPVVKTYAPPATNVFVTQNNIPSTIPQGNTVYRSAGFQTAAYGQFDRNAYLHGVNELQKGFVAGVQSSMSRADTLAQSWAQADATILGPIANAQAMETTLNALGVNLGTQAQAAQSNAVVLNRDASGRLQIFKLDEQQMARVNSYVQGGGNPQVQAAQQSSYPMLTLFCAKCHSPDLPQAKGGIYLGDHPSVASSMKERFFSIVDAVSSGRMPPQGEQQPSAEQKAALFNEVQQIVKQHASNSAPQPQYQPRLQAAPSNDPPPAPLPDNGGM